jgi:hypothetical protein
MNTTNTQKHWHYLAERNLLWLFRGSTDGYTDTSSEYKYYIQLNNSNNFEPHYVSTTSLENSTNLPAIYIFTEDDGSGDDTKIYLKENNTWVQYSKVFKKINGSWIEQIDLTTIFNTSNNYRKGN